ncbi:microbial collagenase [Streptacidiphilus sp. MAP12-16]|uniref:collagenase n=1 Tax=Streptacidiphilus sp. MAP12-16 TaxID=3156300 RepID=UPI0035122BF9
MRHRSAMPRVLAAALAAIATAACLLTTPAMAAPAPTTAAKSAAKSAASSSAATRPEPVGLTNTAVSDQADVRTTPIPAAQHRPSSLPMPRTASAAVRPGVVAGAAAQSCTPADFAGRSGSALVAYIRASTPDPCIFSLFAISGTGAQGVFSESHMSAVAKAFQGGARAYPGNNSTNLWQLVLFLRAGLYLQSNSTNNIPAYSATLMNAIETGIDTFAAGPHFLDVNSDNGYILNEVIILTDNAGVQGRYLNLYKRVLNAYNSSYDAYWSMDSAANAVYTPLWNGNWNPDFVSAVTADPSIADTLNAFALNHLSLLGGTNDVLDSNAGNDLARLLEHPALQAKIRPLVKGLLRASHITGPTAGMWVHVASQSSSYDSSQCSYYGVCNLTAQVTAASLPTTYACGSTITILAQALSPADLKAVCASLHNQIPYYHNLVKDNGPIPGQYVTNVKFAIFGSSLDYQTYSWVIFGNSTNNGGETLTGNITDPNNQPVSVMYQWATDNGFVARVWNLNHEFTHLLQSAYDMKGDFTTQISYPDIWWIEGQAEFVSYSYRGVSDTQAVSEAGTHRYALSTLFQSTYDNSDVVRTYPWGYLAVRYMVEKHPTDVYNMLAKMRVGDYQGAYALYNSIGTGYDADFNSWLDACATGACAISGGPTASFNAAVSGLAVRLTDQSTDTGSSITARSWNFGDGTSSTATNPSKTYAHSGTYTVSLTVTDAKGLTSMVRKSVTVSGSGTLPACTSTNVAAMDRNCSRANQSASTGNYDYLWIYLPAGTSTLTVTTNGGTGNADLYFNPSTWATNTSYTARSTHAGNTESITVTNTTAGYRYISLYAATGFSGVTVSTSY